MQLTIFNFTLWVWPAESQELAGDDPVKVPVLHTLEGGTKRDREGEVGISVMKGGIWSSVWFPAGLHKLAKAFYKLGNGKSRKGTAGKGEMRCRNLHKLLVKPLNEKYCIQHHHNNSKRRLRLTHRQSDMPGRRVQTVFRR